MFTIADGISTSVGGIDSSEMMSRTKSTCFPWTRSALFLSQWTVGLQWPLTLSLACRLNFSCSPLFNPLTAVTFFSFGWNLTSTFILGGFFFCCSLMYACILCLETYSAFIHPFWESPHVEQSFKVMTVKDRKRGSFGPDVYWINLIFKPVY